MIRLLQTGGAEQLNRFYRDSLLQDVLPFWFPRAIDHEHGGFLHCFDADGSLLDSDKSVWAQGRMSWMLLTLYNTLEKRPEWLDWGRHGVRFLEQHGFDQDGRMFFHLNRRGEPIRKRRYAYSESFASIAMGALFRATGEEFWRSRAIELFRHFLDWNFTPGRMPPKFTATRPMIGIGPLMIAMATAQSLRQDLGDDPLFDQWIVRCLHEIREKFVRHDLRAVLEGVAPDGGIIDHFDGRILNPGHAIEAAWFILDEADRRQDRQWIELGCRMLEYSWERGWDCEYGGLFYFRDLYQRPVSEYWQDMKFWWPHNEAVIACLRAYQLTADVKYADWHQQVHDWSFRHFADPQDGEWFGYLHRDGSRSSTIKGNLWKSCFHHPRMLWRGMAIAEQLANPDRRSDA
jgi:N-acylglucosamine 2-epimerase